jgi:hypothetical protein
VGCDVDYRRTRCAAGHSCSPTLTISTNNNILEREIGEGERLRALEGTLSIRELAALTGLSERQARRRLERAEALREPPSRDDLDRFDYEHMELSDREVAPARAWCDPDGPGGSEGRGGGAEVGLERRRVLPGTYHVGGQVRFLYGGVVTTDDASRADGKPHPTTYSPDPTLKGGRDR